jgi:hypothetical protein
MSAKEIRAVSMNEPVVFRKWHAAVVGVILGIVGLYYGISGYRESQRREAEEEANSVRRQQAGRAYWRDAILQEKVRCLRAEGRKWEAERLEREGIPLTPEEEAVEAESTAAWWLAKGWSPEATAEQMLGDARGDLAAGSTATGKAYLECILKQFPKAPAAKEAREELKKLK